MKKNAIRWWVVLGVVLVVYNVLAFALPFPKTAVFAVSYLFTTIAILAQIYVIRTAFYRGEGVKSKFYGFPIAKLGVIYLAVQLIAGLVFMALGLIVPVWLPLALYVVLLGVAAAGFVAADAARDEVVRQEVKLENKTLRQVSADYERVKRVFGPEQVEVVVQADKQREQAEKGRKRPRGSFSRDGR